MASSKVSNAVRLAFEESMAHAKKRVRDKDFEEAWAALERAHARVGLFRPMPLAPDVQAILSSHQV